MSLTPSMVWELEGESGVRRSGRDFGLADPSRGWCRIQAIMETVTDDTTHEPDHKHDQRHQTRVNQEDVNV